MSNKLVCRNYVRTNGPINNQFVKCCLEGKVDDMLKEIRKKRGNHNTNSSVIDGKVGDEPIANHFSNIYEELFSSVKSDNEMNDFLKKVNTEINDEELLQVDKVSESLLKEAIDHLRKGKSDVEFDWKSEAFIVGVDSLASPLAFLFKTFLIHGHISKFLLLCSLVPIIKDKLGDKTSSNNYRAIAISSLIMKLFDWILLILFGKELAPSYYQFGFMRKCSTTMCSWVVTETINYFTNRKTPVFCVLLDLTKAFDMVKFSTLFKKLYDRIPKIFLRLLMFSYMNQQCLARWNLSKSKLFSIHNGVR